MIYWHRTVFYTMILERVPNTTIITHLIAIWIHCHSPPVIECLLIIIIELELDYIETISIFWAFAAIPMTVYYFVKTIMLVFNNINNYQQILIRNRNPILGWYLFNLMCEYYTTDAKRISKNSKLLFTKLYFQVWMDKECAFIDILMVK